MYGMNMDKMLALATIFMVIIDEGKAIEYEIVSCGKNQSASFDPKGKFDIKNVTQTSLENYNCTNLLSRTNNTLYYTKTHYCVGCVTAGMVREWNKPLFKYMMIGCGSVWKKWSHPRDCRQDKAVFAKKLKTGKISTKPTARLSRNFILALAVIVVLILCAVVYNVIVCRKSRNIPPPKIIKFLDQSMTEEEV